MSGKAFPTHDIYEITKKIPKPMIEEVRQKFLALANKNPELYYPADVERVKTNDWTVRRYLYSYKSEPEVNKGLEALDKAMKWRKSFGVLDIKESEFPREFYQCNGATMYGKDKNGTPMAIGRQKMMKKSSTWWPVNQRISIFFIEKYDRENDATGKGITAVTDMRKCIPKNVDMDGAKWMTQVVYDYYPGLIISGIIYKMPSVLEGVYKIMKSWLNEEQNKYIYLVDKKTVTNYIDLDQLPEFMKGTNPAPFVTPTPPGLASIHEVAERVGIKKEKADKMLKWCQKFIEN